MGFSNKLLLYIISAFFIILFHTLNVLSTVTGETIYIIDFLILLGTSFYALTITKIQPPAYSFLTQNWTKYTFSRNLLISFSCSTETSFTKLLTIITTCQLLCHEVIEIWLSTLKKNIKLNLLAALR